MTENNTTTHARHFSLLGSALHIGFYIVASVLLFLLIGIWLDRTFGTMPLFIILGVLMSLFVSLYEVYRIIRKVGGASGRTSR